MRKKPSRSNFKKKRVTEGKEKVREDVSLPVSQVDSLVEEERECKHTDFERSHNFRALRLYKGNGFILSFIYEEILVVFSEIVF
mmetsp:Transcript_57797/g.65949  ORF Transcript_57797/g.65949 Transcript_57797/m.65949 type:complete len:84 (-) Transcript_57797:40-291(-)